MNNWWGMICIDLRSNDKIQIVIEINDDFLELEDMCVICGNNWLHIDRDNTFEEDCSRSLYLVKTTYVVGTISKVHITYDPTWSRGNKEWMVRCISWCLN